MTGGSQVQVKGFKPVKKSSTKDMDGIVWKLSIIRGDWWIQFS